MFSGESELMARRRVLAVLQDEMRKVVESVRELAAAYSALVNNDTKTLQEIVQGLTKAEDDVGGLRRSLARELAGLGTIIMNREDALRTAYTIENIESFINGIAFRTSQIDHKVLKSGNLAQEIRELMDMGVEIIQRLNEVVRSLTVNPAQTMDLASNVEKIERQMDLKYRTLMGRVLREVDSVKDLIMLLDMIERVEDMADACLNTSDSVTILALGL